MRKTLANAGHTLISAGAFVFDDDDDYLSGDQLNTHRFKLQVNIRNLPFGTTHIYYTTYCIHH